VLGLPSNDISEDARNLASVLDEGPRRSGGRRTSLLAGSALPDELKRLAAELKHQYRITYSRPNSLIPRRRICPGAALPKSGRSSETLTWHGVIDSSRRRLMA